MGFAKLSICFGTETIKHSIPVNYFSTSELHNPKKCFDMVAKLGYDLEIHTVFFTLHSV